MVTEPTDRLDLLDAIGQAITQHPRTLQPEIGPSEVGDRCARRLGYKLLGYRTINTDADAAWKPTIGTAVHAWLEDVFGHTQHSGRWLTERRVYPDDELLPVGGSCDLFDTATHTVIDFKIVGPYMLAKYRDEGPSHEYRIQAHIYGLGYSNEGVRVDHVAVLFLPRDGDLSAAYLWTEPYDPQVAESALNRLATIKYNAEKYGDAVLGKLLTASAYCRSCPFLRVGSTDLSRGCPGDGYGEQRPATPTVKQSTVTL